MFEFARRLGEADSVIGEENFVEYGVGDTCVGEVCVVLSVYIVEEAGHDY